MNEERKFTNRDNLLGACQTFEVGLPWEDRWNKNDAFYGRCTDEQVGQSKDQLPGQDQQSPADQDQQLDDATVLRICAERGIDPHDAEAKARIMLEIAPVDFARKSPQLFIDIVKQQRIDKEREAARNIDADEITAKVLSRLSDLEHDRAIVRAFEMAPADCRAYLRHALGLTDELLAEMQQDQA